MNNYKYSLAKKGKSICPECGHKTFVLYLDNITGEPLHPTVGKCDRADNCDHHYPPREYFKENNIPFDRNTANVPRMKPASEPQREPSYIDTHVLKRSLVLRRYKENLFAEWLRKIVGDEATFKAIDRYYIGTSDNGSTVFWLIDTENRIRTGKIILYDNNGHRRKDVKPPVHWIHAALKLPNFNLSPCLFGEHLLLLDTTKPVAIVESEKTAIIASIYLPDMIWLACGGCGNLSLKLCEPLRGRKVILYPDVGMFEYWSERAKELSKICKVSVSSLFENDATDEDRQAGFDLADYLVRLLPDGHTGRETAKEVSYLNPILLGMHNRVLELWGVRDTDVSVMI